MVHWSHLLVPYCHYCYLLPLLCFRCFHCFHCFLFLPLSLPPSFLLPSPFFFRLPLPLRLFLFLPSITNLFVCLKIVSLTVTNKQKQNNKSVTTTTSPPTTTPPPTTHYPLTNPSNNTPRCNISTLCAFSKHHIPHTATQTVLSFANRLGNIFANCLSTRLE